MTPRMLWRRMAALLSRRRRESELNEELDFHLAMQARKHRDAGIDADEAIRLARLEFGNVELVKEDARDVRGVRPLEEFVHDARYALRALRRTPAFAVSVVLTIGLGVGVNASVFAIFNAYVLRPFDVRDPYSLYSVDWMDRSGRMRGFSWTDYTALRARSPRGPMISDLAAYRPVGVRLNGVASTGEAVTENYFNMLGVRPALGRTLVPDDRSTAVVVLGHATWQSRFGGDSNVVGRRVLLRGNPFLIVGVAQSGFEGLFKKPRDFWVPIGALALLDSIDPIGRPGREDLSILSRLAPSVSEAQGRTVLASALDARTSAPADSSRVARVFLTSRASAIPRSFRSYLAFAPLAVAFALVLLLACANVANMLLARGLVRQRELGIRLALGAARARLVRQLVTECVVLSLPSVAVGFALSWVAVDVGVRALFAALPPDLAAFVRLVPLHPDARVVVFAFAAALISSFVFGLVPSLQATKLSVVQATRGTFAAESSPTRLRNVLVVGQITVASMLLITAAILLREAGRLGQVDPGLRTHDVISVEPEQRSRVAVVASLSASPLVGQIAASGALPLDMRFPLATVAPNGDSTLLDVMYNKVSASYFEVLGITIASGRTFTAQEEAGPASVVIVSEAVARQLWPTGTAIGRTIHLRPSRPGTADSLSRYQDARVIGVARNVVVQSVENGKERPVLYFPTTIEATGCCLLLRARGDPMVAKRTLDLDLERAVPGGVSRIDRMATFVAGAVFPYRAAYWVSLTLGLVALGLTVVGVYGVVAYVVGQRTREIGVRMALGASTADVLALILRQSLRQALTGAAIGAVLALIVARVLASNVESVPVFDPVAFVGASACVIASCLIAAFIPSRRAATINPTAALRHD